MINQVTPVEVFEERERHNKLVKQFNTKAIELAEKQATYDKLRSVATLQERENKVPITIIKTIVDGREDVAQAKFEVSVCKAMLDTIDRAIDDSKWQQKVLMDQISREWGRNGN